MAAEAPLGDVSVAPRPVRSRCSPRRIAARPVTSFFDPALRL